MSAVPVFPSEAPPGLAGSMLKSAASVPKDVACRAAALNASTDVAASGLFWVRRPDGSKSSLTSMGILLAPSGAGKSHHLRHAVGPIYEWAAKRCADTLEAQHHQEARIRSWRKRVGVAESDIARDYSGENGNVEAHEEHLRRLIASKPARDARPTPLYNDATAQAILHGLNGWPIAGWLSDEGGHALSMMRPRDFHTLASLWDGNWLPHNRVQGGRMEIQPFFSMLLAVQNDVHFEFLAKRGKLFKASGAEARLLPYLVPENWVGTEAAFVDGHGDEDAYARYTNRTQDLLDQGLKNVHKGFSSLPLVECSPEARSELLKLRCHSQELMRDPKYAACVDFLAKMSDHVLRMAAKWHVFEGREGNISLEFVERAARVIRYHLEVYHLLHCKPAHERVEVRDAASLFDIIRHACRDRAPTRGELMNLAFNAGIGSSTRFSNALGLLGLEGKVEITRRGHVRLPAAQMPQAVPRAGEHAVNHMANDPRFVGRFD